MTVGLGVSIGTVNTVCAVENGGGNRNGPPATWRTTLTFDSTGTARVGRIPKHGRAITDFADLTQRGTPNARVGHRALSAADLVATVASSVLSDVLGAAPEPEHGITVTHPVGYPPQRVDDLREALDAVGLRHAVLAAEPIAATAWLEETCGPLMPGLALVYDLGGSGLRVTLVRVGAGAPRNPVVGESLRSTDFGGRAFGAQMARRADWRSAETPHVATDAVITERRTAHVRKSLDVVYECLRVADVTMADVDRVLVIGGAARPPEVAAVLAAALARPVIVAPDPERTVAEGAAILARRASEAEHGGVGQRRAWWSGGTVRAASGRLLGRRLTRAVITASVTAGAALFVATAPAGDAVSVGAITNDACLIHLYG
ncbi:molecular chaperone HscA [Nocardia transvalensis]|uniref:Molecular chaperone HscA n=1 Tax=Nocardia transvalensis TaxID=37333 RepID=A0A7W9PLW3_9NOCA|nr:Hsp70 family protein [Nocardia transvalensis]MBB5918562.1 molecular chaperone HscA [Nocardia transvalensis]